MCQKKLASIALKSIRTRGRNPRGMRLEITSLTHMQVQQLFDSGKHILCLVTANDAKGLRLTAICYVYDDGCAIDVVFPNGPDSVLKVGEPVLYNNAPTKGCCLQQLEPSDSLARQMLAAAREELLPETHAN